MADLSHKERGNKTEHENAGGDKLLPIYLAILDGEKDKNRFELLYVTYRKLMFYVANRILMMNGSPRTLYIRRFENSENFDGVGKFPVTKLRATLLLWLETPPSIYITKEKARNNSLEDVEYCITTDNKRCGGFGSSCRGIEVACYI